MIRFIVQRHEQDHNSGLERHDFVTVDVSVPELERLLRQGGRGEMGFENWQLLGAELLEEQDTVQMPRKLLDTSLNGTTEESFRATRDLLALLAGGAE